MEAAAAEGEDSEEAGSEGGGGPGKLSVWGETLITSIQSGLKSGREGELGHDRNVMFKWLD